MRAVVQRVTSATVSTQGRVVGVVGHGLVVLLGIEEADSADDIEWLVGKLVHLRIFGDESGSMNLSVREVNGEIMVVSQFTLHAYTKKGNRPSFIRAAKPEVALPLYERFVKAVTDVLGKPTMTGEFGAMMQVNLVNDGPVTIILDSKQRDF
jgi:D-tyrosyl-tRNA(Tyr) deacylase